MVLSTGARYPSDGIGRLFDLTLTLGATKARHGPARGAGDIAIIKNTCANWMWFNVVGEEEGSPPTVFHNDINMKDF